MYPCIWTTICYDMARRIPLFAQVQETSINMKTFSITLKRMIVVAIILKIIVNALAISVFGFVGFLFTTPLILALLGYMAYGYYNKTMETNKLEKSILLVILSSVISFVVVFVIVMVLLKVSGYHG